MCRATGCEPIANVDLATNDSLGKAGAVRSKRAGGRSMVECQGLGVAPARTILLHAPTSSMFDEVERSIHDALCAVITAFKFKSLVPGGGAVQLELASRLRHESLQGTQSAEQIGYSILADALEVLPLTIASNGGLDGPDMVAQGRRAHHDRPEGLFVGIDLDRQCLRDMVRCSPLCTHDLLASSSS
jgi:chaperonin GroEL (HSP60 family)